MSSVLLDQTFYVGEYGMYIQVATGIDMTGAQAGDLRFFLLRPDGSEAVRDVDPANIVDPAEGTVNVPIVAGDFTIGGGVYQGVVGVKDASLRMQPSHPFRFFVAEPIMGTVPSMFA